MWATEYVAALLPVGLLVLGFVREQQAHWVDWRLLGCVFFVSEAGLRGAGGVVVVAAGGVWVAGVVELFEVAAGFLVMVFKVFFLDGWFQPLCGADPLDCGRPCIQQRQVPADPPL